MNRPLSGEVWRRTAIIHRTVRWCTGLSGEPTVDCAKRSAARSAGDAWPKPTDSWRTGLSGVHRTVSGEPRRPLLQRSAEPDLVGDHAPDMLQDLSGGAPDCPVVHRTVRWCTGLSGAPPDRKQILPSKMNSNGS
jgi:hypothetical protein